MKREKNRNKITIFRKGQNVGNIPSLPKWIIVFLCFAFFLLLTKPTLGAGVTIITHGFVAMPGLLENKCYPQNDWVNQMGDAVAARAGTSTAVYNMHINFTFPFGALYVESFDFEKGDIPGFSLNPNCEVVIKLYWDKVANNVVFPYANTTDIAVTVVPYLTKWNAGQGLVNPLVEMPIHLIGHSRGGSVVSEMAKLLAASGIWVDQVTTLDPHPIQLPLSVASDKISVGQALYPHPLFLDPDVMIYDNIIFADDYYQTLDRVTFGYSIDGSYLEFLNGKLNEDGLDASYHTQVYYWYHGTIDLNVATLDCDSIPRDIWYTPNDFGYRLSRITDGQTLRGTMGAKDGLKWAGAVRSNDYTRYESGNQWPNIELENMDDKWVVKVGDTVQIQFRYQDYDTSASIELIIDDDRNPYNNSSENTILIESSSKTGSIIPAPIFYWAPKPDDNGKYLYAKTTDSLGLTRYHYLGKPFHVTDIKQTRIIRLDGELDFGEVQVGRSAQRTMTIYNSGNSTLSVSSISYPNGFSGNWNGAIGSGSSQPVTVTFAPTEDKIYSGNVIVSSDATSGTNTRSISGTTKGATHILTVASSNPNSGVSITVSPNDNGSQGNGATQFKRTYNNNTTVTLTASLTTGRNSFQKWQRDGADWTTSQTTNVTMSADCTMTAAYATTTPTPTSICNAANLDAEPEPLRLEKEEGADETVTVTCEDGSPVAGVAVTSTVQTGKQRIFVSPSSAVTDVNGQATFTVTATQKTGNAKVRFEAAGLRDTVKMKVVR